MKLDRKTVSKGLLGFIGVQVLFVGAGLSYRYLSPQEEQIVRNTKANEYYQDEIYCGAIKDNPSQYPVEPIRDEAGEFKIYTIGTTTGSSGDSAVIAIPA